MQEQKRLGTLDLQGHPTVWLPSRGIVHSRSVRIVWLLLVYSYFFYLFENGGCWTGGIPGRGGYAARYGSWGAMAGRWWYCGWGGPVGGGWFWETVGGSGAGDAAGLEGSLKGFDTARLVSVGTGGFTGVGVDGLYGGWWGAADSFFMSDSGCGAGVPDPGVREPLLVKFLSTASGPRGGGTPWGVPWCGYWPG